MPVGQPTLYEYFYDEEQNLWVPWNDKVPSYVHDPEKRFSDILVPTVDTVRTMWLLDLQVCIRRSVLLVGETGTSKSATTSNFLRELDKDAYVSHCAAFRCALKEFPIICFGESVMIPSDL